MNRKQLLLTLSVAIISGLLGGAVSVWFLMPQSVLALSSPIQSTRQNINAGLVTARMLLLRDEDGDIRVTISPDMILMSDANGDPRFLLRTSTESAALSLSDGGGKVRALVATYDEKPPLANSPQMIRLFDEEEKLVWEAP